MKIKQFALTLSLCCMTVSSFASPATDKSVDKLMQLSNITALFSFPPDQIMRETRHEETETRSP
jgi:hypothetical protein